MKLSRIPALVVVGGAFVVAMLLVREAAAIDRYWQGDVSSIYNQTPGPGNWNATNGNAPSPRATQLERAVIGTDDPAGALNSDLAPFGSPTLAGGALNPGGIGLGVRARDINDIDQDNDRTEFLYEPPPVAGTLVGRFSLSTGASLTLDTTSQANFGADGRLLVGVEGRGYFTMTGGTLTARALVVAGENITTDAGMPNELGPSLVDLSGTSTLNVTNPADQTSAITDFGRRLRVEGASVMFETQGRLRLLGTNTYTAVITSPTLHSALRTGGVANVGGNLFVEFSGAGATHSVGQTWNLVDAAVNVVGNFSNLGVGGDVQVSGVPTPPVGSAYRLKKVPSGGRTLLQLSLEKLLVLEVNRDTGDVSITNPHNGSINIDSYLISSTLGSLVDTYDGISGSMPPPSPNWVKAGLSENALTEVINDPVNDDTVFPLLDVASVPLGEGFNRLAVAGDVDNFGTDGEDLVFQYSAPGTGIIRGHVHYTGTKFENNLVLRVDPDTGQAFLKNDSLETLTFDGFSIQSSTGALDSTSFAAVTGGTGTWLTDSSPGGDALSQVNFTGARTLSPTDEVAIGNITNSAALDAAGQAGLSMEFILAESLVSTVAFGDYNENGVVDAADYTTWRDRLGQNVALPNTDPNDTDGMVTMAEYDFWKSQFGTVGSGGPEPTFRIGSVVFDDMGGGGSLASVAVPEPGAGLLALVGAVCALVLPRRVAGRTMRREPAEFQRACGVRGSRSMLRRGAACLTVVAAIVVLAFSARPAAAVTGGIPLANFDMELPGPVGTKTVAFATTAPYVPTTVIPGWTFTGGMGGIGEVPGEGGEDFGDGVPGDSGTEGGGNPGNEILLSTNDGRVYQIAAGSSIVNPEVNQQYKLGFDARDIFTIDANNTGVPMGFQLTARFFYGAYPGTTLETLDVNPTGTSTHFEVLIGHDDPRLLLPGVVGQTLGVEFDTTSREFNAMTNKSWAGIDNVVFEIAGVLPGDLNGDGVVNLSDTTNLIANLQEYTPFEANGELNGDNTVNLNDFRILKNLLPAGTGNGSASGSGQTVPEPSSLTLLLLSFAAIFVSRKRWSRSIAALVMFACGGLLVGGRSASATLLVYDPFNIGPGAYSEGPLHGQTSSTPSFFAGPWQGQGGPAGAEVTGQVVQATGLSYLGAPAEGGSVTSTGGGRAGIFFANPLGGAGSLNETGTFYFSFLANFGNVADPNTDAGTMGFRTVEFFPIGQAAVGEGRNGELGFQGYGGEGAAPSVARLGWRAPGAGGARLPGSADVFNDFGGTHLLVIKFVLSADNNMDSASLYVDPVSTLEPEEPTQSVSGVNLSTSGFTTLSFFFNAFPPLPPVFDELRIATTFVEALPALPLPGDTDGDDDVDLDDYQNIVDYMNVVNPPNTPTLHPDVAKADGTQGSDGRVTIADYRLWRDNRSDLGSGAASVAGQFGVPEPSTLVLALVAVVGYGQLHRRRRWIER